MSSMACRAFAPEALADAWRQVLANDMEDGVESPSVQRFAEDLEDRLADLSGALLAGEFEPNSLTPVTITIGEKLRELHIPSVSDRIVARAVLGVAGQMVDPHLGPAAFAYRPGLGVVDAVQEVTKLRAEGLGWVLRTDVKDCFPSLPKDLAQRRFEIVVGDDLLTTVVSRLLHRTFRAPTGGIRTLDGVPQGCPLSPMLANLVLVDLDEALLRAGFPVVRYGDDLVVAASSPQEATVAWECAADTVEALGMELNNDKTRVVSFAEGFTFLGEDFGPRYPPHLDEHRVTDPDTRVLYVAQQGAGVRTQAGRIIVESADDTELLDVPSSQVERIVLFGSVGLSAGVRSWSLGTGVDVVFASRKGNYLGTQLSHEQQFRPGRLRAQMAFADSPRAMTFAREVVAAKIAKQRVVLQRFNRRDTHEDVASAIEQMDHLLTLLPEANHPQEAMGIEGAAARVYFPSFGLLVPEELRFSERTRQPPQDTVNAALSFLYTILLGECVTALHAAGLAPTFGVLHAEQKSRPSLALDLVEEFRPWIVDQVVLEACRHGRLTAEHSRREPARGVLLTKKGKEAVVDAYERRMLTQVAGALPDYTGTRRHHIYRQALRLRATIKNPEAEWTGLSWRP